MPLPKDVEETELFGDTLGHKFTDEDIIATSIDENEPRSSLKQVVVVSSSVIDGLYITYHQGTGANRPTLPRQHGTSKDAKGVNLTSIAIDLDEFDKLVDVTGTYGEFPNFGLGGTQLSFVKLNTKTGPRGPASNIPASVPSPILGRTTLPAAAVYQPVHI
ncbi:hypothetical protein B0H14DRAFT_3011845 [Mycena olivaceomarginata]|nr:hypothetical protein B0H14DRAFT_3011845 [Mycena olivaceomarginata]